MPETPTPTRRRVQAFADRLTAALAGGTIDPATLPIASPWTTSTLQRLVFEDIFGTDVPPVGTRAAAMRIPPIARGRNLLVSTICRMPLVRLTAGQTLPAADDQAGIAALAANQPAWLTRGDTRAALPFTLAWTIDDLVFYGWSLWWRNNAADNFPGDVHRVNQEDWRLNDDNRIEVHGQVVDDRNVILIPGLHEGILSSGRDAIRDASTIYRIVRDRLANPVPQVDLHQTGGEPLTKDERTELITEWAAARNGANGGVAYTSEFLEVNELTGGDAQLMIEARNAAALDLARVIGVSAGLLDATVPKASLNYETATGRNQEFVDRDLYLYMTPITARLSMDDVTPRGSRVEFDLTDFTSPAMAPTGPITRQD